MNHDIAKFEKININIIASVWGENCIRLFIEITLASILLPAEKNNIIYSYKFLIFTPLVYKEKISCALSSMFPFNQQEFIDFDPNSYPNSEKAVQAANYRGALISIGDRARAIFLPPDAVLSAGTFSHIAEVVSYGKRALFTIGPRLNHDAAYSLLKTELDEYGELSSRKLSDLLITHAHPDWLRYHWASDNFSAKPFAVIWDAPQGWLARAFDFYLLMIDFSDDDAAEHYRSNCISKNNINYVVDRLEDVCVVQDSDDLLMCRLTPNDLTNNYDSLASNNFDSLHLMAFNSIEIKSLNRWFFTKSICIHIEDLNYKWLRIKDETDYFAACVLSGHTSDLSSSHSDKFNGLASSFLFESVPKNEDKYRTSITEMNTEYGFDEKLNYLENHVSILRGTQLQGHCCVGRGTELNDATIYPFSRIGRYCHLENKSVVGAPNPTITGLTSSLQINAVRNAFCYAGTIIGNDVRIGAGAVVSENLTIGHGAIIRPGSVVINDVKPYSIMSGVPAAEIGMRFPEIVSQSLLAISWWNLPHCKIVGLPIEIDEILDHFKIHSVSYGFDDLTKHKIERAIKYIVNYEL